MPAGFDRLEQQVLERWEKIWQDPDWDPVKGYHKEESEKEFVEE